MPQSPETILTQKLDHNERLLWSGQPLRGIRLRAQDARLIPFSILWCSFAIFWEYMALTQTLKAPTHTDIVFPLFGLFFVFFGLYFLFGRFFVDALNRAHMFYGITSDRIIIVSGLFSQQIKSLQLRTLTDVSLTERSDGSGTITFGPTYMMNAFSRGNFYPGRGGYAPPSFDLIEHAKDVYDIVRNAQRTASSNT